MFQGSNKLNISAKSSILQPGDQPYIQNNNRHPTKSSNDIKQADRAYLTWNNLAYFVPKKAAKTH